jgi:hypothetical protein
MPSLKRPVRTSTVGRLCRAVLTKRSASCLGLAPPSAALVQNLFIIRPWYARWKHGWLAAIQTLNQGTVEAADFFPARLHGRVGGLRGSRSRKSADFQSIGAGRPQAAAL